MTVGAWGGGDGDKGLWKSQIKEERACDFQ